MKHKNGFNPLSRRSAHRKALHRNMVTSLFKYERITTTKQKAKEIKRTAEKLITRARVDSVHNRREIARFIWDDAVLNKLFTNIGPRMQDRNGGYTRVIKLGFREGDAAEVALLELVDYSFEEHEKLRAEKNKDKKKADSKSDSKEKKATKSSKADSTKADVAKKSAKSESSTQRRYNRVKGS